MVGHPIKSLSRALQTGFKPCCTLVTLEMLCLWYSRPCSGALTHYFPSMGAVCLLVLPFLLLLSVGWLEEADKKKKNHILQPFYIFFLSDCGFYFSLAMAALMGEANKQFT